MKCVSLRNNPLCLLLLLLLSQLTHTALANEDFALLDQHGSFHQLSRYLDKKALVLLVYSNASPAAERALSGFDSLRTRYQEQDIVFLLLNAVDEPVAIKQKFPDPAVDPRVLIDDAQIVARTLGVSSLAEVLVLDPDSYRISYQGALDSSFLNPSAAGPVQPYVEEVLEAVLAGNELPADYPAFQGEPLVYRYQQAIGEREISYQDEIVPILRRHCTRCHVEEGLAPWAMSSYIMVLGWSPMMRETLITRRMPPGQIDERIGDWTQSHRLSDEELAVLIEWIDRGAPRQGEDDPLAATMPADEEWPAGEPDLIVEVPPETVPATGIVDYLLKTVELDLPADKWLSGVAYSAGDKSVLHSLLVYAVDKNAQISAPEDLISARNADFISVFVPGNPIDRFAEDSGFLLQADQNLSFKIRYLSSGRETVDASRVGLYFRDTAPKMALSSIALGAESLSIPANRNNHEEVASSEVLEQDTWVESFSPHAHNRGKSMTVSALYPDGRQELLINVANYNYNWQLAYTLRQRKLLPAGTRLQAVTVYDNSIANPFNPDPEQAVNWGVTTWDEMFVHFVRIARERLQ
ncbi:MAG: redoxin domain-containing protein [Pseudomonadales bacterium]|nr:redoxin domain-containing protein [Pseudomonadales bacterium]